MQNRNNKLTRRDFLKAMGLGVAGTVAAGWMGSGLASKLLKPMSALAAPQNLALVATDGYMTMPARETDPIYIFGFVPVDPNASVSTLIPTYKGHTKHTAPTLDFKQNDDIKITLTNLGLLQRPDQIGRAHV